ncbi:glycosyltransferase [Micromonospora sp. M12]
MAPHIDDDQVVFLGSVGPERRAEVLGDSTALLHPIAFDEPFGLSVVESMVCGTPSSPTSEGPCRRSSTKG